MNKSVFLALGAWLLVGSAWADAPDLGLTHRYMIERNFPLGALEDLDAAKKAEINANNSRFGVRWIHSFATADETHTYCLYDGPSEAAIREAAAASGMPVDRVVEVPITLFPE